MGEDLELLRSQLEELRSQLEQREAEVTAREEVRGAPPTEPTDDAETPGLQGKLLSRPGTKPFWSLRQPAAPAWGRRAPRSRAQKGPVR